MPVSKKRKKSVASKREPVPVVRQLSALDRTHVILAVNWVEAEIDDWAFLEEWDAREREQAGLEPDPGLPIGELIEMLIWRLRSYVHPTGENGITPRAYAELRTLARSAPHPGQPLVRFVAEHIPTEQDVCPGYSLQGLGEGVGFLVEDPEEAEDRDEVERRGLYDWWRRNLIESFFAPEDPERARLLGLIDAQSMRAEGSG